MQLIGMLDSPYVRRVAVSLKLLGLPFEHRPLSVFRTFDEFAAINPVVKAPTLITDVGTVLMDSTLILQHAEDLAGPGRSLMPNRLEERTEALQLIGLALAACEKAVQIVYERTLRPAEKQHQPWLDRVERQLGAACDALERAAAVGSPWLVTDRPTQADVSVAVAWRFAQAMIPDVQAVAAERRPSLVAFSKRAEALPEFAAMPHP